MRLVYFGTLLIKNIKHMKHQEDVMRSNVQIRKAIAVAGVHAALFAAACGGALRSDGGVKPEWPAVTREMRPWCYNWWMGSAVDSEGLEAQCSALASAGFGGFHVIPIYGAKGSETKYRRLLSEPWMEAFGDAVRIAGAHGLGVDLTMGSGWCFGGPQLKREEGSWKMFTVDDEKALKPGDKVLWRGVDASGRPRILAVALTGQQVKRAGLGGQGPMMDPYSVTAMESLLAPFTAAFDKAGAVRPEHMYHDSFEYYGAAWTPDLFEAFKAKRGYDLRDHLAELAGIGADEAVARVKCDYRETLSDMMIEDVFPRWTAWCRKRGIATRNEGHGGSVNWLDFYALADVPETEMFGENCRDVLVSKFASSAAHVTGKPMVASESCTWLNAHFTETLAEAKVFIDLLFLSGVNHMFYHGCCYSPVGVPWPGWCFYAAAEINPRNPVWRDIDALNAYITRCQSMFRSCEPDNDVLVYWPIRDCWMRDREGFVTLMSVHNASAWFGSQPIGHAAKALYDAGYSFDYISDRQLAGLDPSRRRYAALVVPPCRHMPKKTAERIAELEAAGLKVFRDGAFPDMVRKEPFDAKSGLRYVRHRKGTDHVYFIVNTSDSAVRGKPVRLSAACGAAWAMDPMTGRIDAMPMENGAVKLSLEPKQSVLLYAGAGAERAAAEVRAQTECEPFEVDGEWTLEPVCGGPEPLPPRRTTRHLSGWERNADGTENPFCGTMRYSTVFDAPRTNATVIDLGDVRQSAHVVLNGIDLGKAILPPFRLLVPAGVLRDKGNVLEVEVTSVAANRLRQMDKDGVKWRIFNDINFVYYPIKECNVDASHWPLTVNGLLGPVTFGSSPDMRRTPSASAHLACPSRCTRHRARHTRMKIGELR